MIKELMKAIGINTYEDEYRRLKHEHEVLQHSHEILKDANNILAHDIIGLEKQMEQITKEPDRYVQEQIDKYRVQLEDEMNHKWYNIGRADSFGYYGVQVIKDIDECRRLGMYPVIWVSDGEYCGVLGLEDVVENNGHECVKREDVLNGEIPIDDLEHIGA